MSALLLLLLTAPASAEDDGPGPSTSETALKWLRDSAEYHAITTQT